MSAAVQDEYPLSITDPKDGKFKHIGTMLLLADDSRCWVRRINNEHVMRSGRLGMDAHTYDTHFAGRRGTIRVVQGPRTHEVTFDQFEAHRTEADYGHGRQYFLAFGYWRTTGPAPSVPTHRPPPEHKFEPPPAKVAFGAQVVCKRCIRRPGMEPRSKGAPCISCGGSGFREVGGG